MDFSHIDRILVDARNWSAISETLIPQILATNEMIGVDIETNDADRHKGLNLAMGVDAEGRKSSNKKLIFDTNRTTVTGFSLHIKHSNEAYYVNLNHADEENRVPWEQARHLLEAAQDKYKVAHNAPFELTMLRKSLGFNLGEKLICSMQLAVSAFNDDTYDVNEFAASGLGEIPKLFGAVNREFAHYNPGDPLNNEQSELLYKVIAKESIAAHSYAGLIKTLAYGYGLKALTKRFLGYEQKTFEQTLNGKVHMGQLTGEETYFYGADDAIVCVYLYDELVSYIMRENPAVLKTFFEQENPMIHVYSQVWGTGVKIDLDSVKRRRAVERSRVAETLREMKAAVRSLLPFPAEPHEKLVKYDAKLYKPEKYRGDVNKWTLMPDSEEDYIQLYQVKSALSKQWAEDEGDKEPKGISINYYQVMRCILYDLCGCSFQLSDGKIQSDGEARRIMEERWIKHHEREDIAVFILDEGSKTKGKYFAGKNPGFARFEAVLKVLECYKQLAESEQVIKLFINTYLNLTDPETGRVYPSISSRLNSRRMALSTPNLSQLPKFGGSAYVRSFFLADEEDHVILTMDWSGIELVLIGEQSQDPEFYKAFGQLPHNDLHSATGAALLELSVEEFKKLPDYKQVRTDVAKPANFGFWFSGSLSQAGKAMGWSSELMWENTDKFKAKYAVAESWRTGTIQYAREHGFVILPDGHSRIRYESTYTWADQMRAKFAQYGPTVVNFGALVIKKTQNRSGNQAVNSMIQGTAATLAKRTLLTLTKLIKDRGFAARIMFVVHDELVVSIRKDLILEFKPLMREVMLTHPEIVKVMKLDCSCAIGRNYLAYDHLKNPYGQIELDEFSKVEGLMEDKWGQRLNDSEVSNVIDYLFEEAA